MLERIDRRARLCGFSSRMQYGSEGVPDGRLGRQQETSQPAETGNQLVFSEGATSQSPMRWAISWKVSHLRRTWLRTWR